jgi:MFS family permease
MNRPLFLFAISLDLMQVALLVPFTADFLVHVGLAADDLGWVQSIYGALQSVSLPLAGTLAQTVGNRPLLLFSVFGTVCSYLLLLCSLLAASTPFFVLSRAMTGFVRQTMTTASALLLDQARSLPERAVNLSQLQFAATFGFVLAPVIAGFVVEQLGVFALVKLSCCTGFVGGCLAYLSTRHAAAAIHRGSNDRVRAASPDAATSDLRATSLEPALEPHVPPRRERGLALLRHALREVFFTDPQLRFLGFALLFQSVAYVCVQSSTSLFLRRAFGFRPSQVGLTVSVSALLTALCQASVGRIVGAGGRQCSGESDAPRKRVLFIAAVSALLGNWALALSAFAPSEWGVCVYAFGLVFSALSGAVDAVGKSSLSTWLGGEQNAVAMSLVYACDGANRMLLPLINAWLIRTTGLTAAPMILAAVAALLALFCHWRGPTGLERPRRRE